MTTTYILAAVTALLAYFIGSINSSVILSKVFFKKDIREEGSGNAGATNMLRTHGKGFALITLAFDILKGVVAVWLAKLIGNVISGETDMFVTNYIIPSFKFIGGFFVVIGHNYPIFFSFKGGKGVATSLGVLLTLNYQVGLIVLIFALIIMILTRYVSLGSILSGIIFIAVDISYMWFKEGEIFLPELLFTMLMAALLIYRHKANIVRLKNGTENKLGKKKEESK